MPPVLGEAQVGWCGLSGREGGKSVGGRVPGRRVGAAGLVVWAAAFRAGWQATSLHLAATCLVGASPTSPAFAIPANLRKWFVRVWTSREAVRTRRSTDGCVVTTLMFGIYVLCMVFRHVHPTMLPQKEWQTTRLLVAGRITSHSRRASATRRRE